MIFKKWKTNRLIKKIKDLKSLRQSQQPKDEAIQREIRYYFELAKIYHTNRCSKKLPYADVRIIECYRAAAMLDSARAHYLLAKYFIDKARFRMHLHQEGVLNSSQNQKDIDVLFGEAHAHLKAAQDLNDIEAKRLRGLAFIQGWGVTADKDKGFELIVESIEQEGSWDKVPQIFSAMGLNNTEFFAQIMQRKK